MDIENSIEKVNNFVLNFTGQQAIDLTGLCSHDNAQKSFKLETTIFLSYMSYDLTRHLSFLLLNEENIAPLIAVTWDQMYPSQLREKPFYIYSYETSFISNSQTDPSQNMMSRLNVTYSVVFYMRECEEDDMISKQNCSVRKDVRLN